MKRQFGGLVALFMVVGLTIGIVHAADIDSNLVAYWPLNGDVNDTIGGHNGSLMGSASFVQDAARGTVLEVDGNDGRAEVPHADDMVFSNTDDYTLSAWVSVLTLPGHWAGVVNKSRDISPHYGIWINGSNQWVAGGTNINGSAVAADGWHHLTIVQDVAANSRTLYLDGEVDVTGGPIDATGSGDLWMGGAKSVSEYIHARIDDVTLYARALTQFDVQELMAGPPTAVEPEAKLTTTWGAMKK